MTQELQSKSPAGRRYDELQGLIEAVEQRLLHRPEELTPHEAQLLREHLRGYGRALLREELTLQRAGEVQAELVKLKEELSSALAQLQEVRYAEGWEAALQAVSEELGEELPTVHMRSPYALEEEREVARELAAATPRSEREIILDFLEKHATQQEVSVTIAYSEDDHLRLHGSENGMAQTAAAAVIASLKKQAEEL